MAGRSESQSEKGACPIADETILIIDDNGEMRLLLSLRLKMHRVPGRLCS